MMTDTLIWYPIENVRQVVPLLKILPITAFELEIKGSHNYCQPSRTS